MKKILVNLIKQLPISEQEELSKLVQSQDCVELKQLHDDIRKILSEGTCVHNLTPTLEELCIHNVAHLYRVIKYFESEFNTKTDYTYEDITSVADIIIMFGISIYAVKENKCN